MRTPVGPGSSMRTSVRRSTISRPNENQYDSDYYGGTLGLDYVLQNGAVLGVAFGYEDYSTDIHSSAAPTPTNPTSLSAGGSVDGNSYVGSAYGTYARDEWYVSLIASYGTADYDLDRRALFLPGPNPVGKTGRRGLHH